jgi:hypothetical protein
MNVTIQKLNGLWHLIVGSCQIRTPFLETQDRAMVVAYARRIYPGAKIFERDWRLGRKWDSTHAGQVCCASARNRFELDSFEGW